MLVVLVDVVVKEGMEAAFMAATVENASNSRKEPGVARFDVLQDRESPTRFTLVEVYRNDQAPAAHKETAHYLKWRDAVADMMAQPRSSRKLETIFPGEEGW